MSKRPSGAQPSSWRKKQPAKRFWSGWRDSPDAGSEIPYWQKLAGSLLAIVVLLLIFVWFNLRDARKTGFRAIAITRYDDPVPPNSFAYEDIQRFGKTFARDGNLEVQRADDSGGSRLTELLEAQLERVLPGGPDREWFGEKKGAVIIYISAHGVVRVKERQENGEDGIEPCLLDGEHDALDSSKWLPVQDVLEMITAESGLEGAAKILILDANRIGENWRMGVLDNRFAEALAETVKAARKQDPGLFVINSTGIGQRGWSSPEIGGSFFAYCVAQALRGAADQSPPDGKISLHELQVFLRERVSYVVSEYRGAIQQPMLIPSEAEASETSQVMLTRCGKYDPEKNAPELHPVDWKQLKERHGRLAELWQRRDDEFGANAATHNPLGWARLNHQLVRLGQVLLAGSAYNFDAEVAQVNGLLKQLQPPELGLKTCSLALARQIGLVSDTALRQASDAFRKLRESPADGDAAAPPAENQPLDYLAACAAGWKWLLESEISPENLQRVVDFVKPLQPPTEFDPPEIHWLRLILGHLAWDSVKSDQLIAALSVEQLASRASAEGDFRSYHWVEDRLPKANRKLGQARDQLFIGDETALQLAEKSWGELRDGDDNSWGQIVNIRNGISQAYQVRDECCTELVDLAQWTMRRRRSREPRDLAESIAQVLQLIENTHELGEVLDRVNKSRNSTSDELQRAVQAGENARNKMDRIRNELQKLVNELTFTDTDATGDLLDLELSLRMTRLRSDDREKLWDNYLAKLSGQTENLKSNIIHSAARDSSRENSEEPTREPTQTEDSLRWVDSATTHPALELLEIPSLSTATDGLSFKPLESSDSAEKQHPARIHRLAKMEEEVRQRIGRVYSVAATAVEASAESSTSDDSASQARLGLSAADRLLRSAAGLLSGPAPPRDPCRRLQHLDAAYVLCWQIEQTLQNFWGSGKPREIAQPKYYFSLAAKRYLEAATGLLSQPEVRLKKPEVRLKRRVEEFYKDIASLERAAHAWPDPAVGRLLLLEEEDALHCKVTLPRFESTYGGDTHGMGTFYFDVPEMPQQRSGFAVVADNPPSEDHDVGLGQARGSVEAVCFYRGHVRPAAVNLPTEKGVAIPFQRPPYRTPVVRVVSDERQVSLVMFVLDCSHSMVIKHKMPTEGEQTRLEIAKKALNTALRSLDSKHYRVGLIAYGHRAGWVTRGGSTHERWSQAKFQGLPPGEDVECLIPSGKVVPDQFGRSLAALDKPFGETPLYLAICEGIDRLMGYRGDDRVASRNLVVITDGADWQTKPGVLAGDVSDDKMRDFSDARDKLKQTAVRLEIVYFGAKPSAMTPSETAEWQDTNTRWEAQKGKFATYLPEVTVRDVRQPEELVDSLRASLKLDQYYVAQVGADTPDRDGCVYLNEAWKVTDFEGDAAYIVNIVDSEPAVKSEIRLEGGEEIKLEFDRFERRLRVARYNEDDDQLQAIPAERPQYLVTAHRPKRRVRDVTFRVSVQQERAGEFCPRPRHVWAEVRPVNERRTVYYFQDRKFQQGLSVPLLEFEAPQFGWTRARLRLWFTFDEDLDWQRKQKLDRPRIDDDDTGLRIVKKVDKKTIRVDELHDHSSEDFRRIELDPPADKVTRTYRSESRHVTHYFAYASELPPVPELLVGAKYHEDWFATDWFTVVIDD